MITGTRPEITFEEFTKIARWNRTITITEKIDGTNATIYIPDDLSGVFAGSRGRWITPEDDNYGFARWVRDHADQLVTLGAGYHRGEWWGAGIQRRYGQDRKRFSLFNTARWSRNGSADLTAPPACCDVVPVLAHGNSCGVDVRQVLEALRVAGSVAAPGFMQPEGIVVYHSASRTYYKMTLDKNDEHKGNPA